MGNACSMHGTGMHVVYTGYTGIRSYSNLGEINRALWT
jgi:hypothetical protein